jgi:hypothetical protein
MRRTIKSALLVVILSVCVVGALFSRHELARDRDQKTRVVPVNNAQPHRRIWLRV